MGRVFVMGDIHGAFKAFMQCLNRSGFEYEKDHLICLGDVADGWPETRQSVEELMKIKHLTYVLGNHDFWALNWMREGIDDDIWLSQGGKATIHSYAGKAPLSHIEFFEKAKRYFLLENKLFVHAGIDVRYPLERQSMQVLLWDRELARTAMSVHLKKAHANITGYDEVYIGHTPVSPPPQRMCEIWFMDTGAGWDGVLSMMDLASKEIFMSDPVPQLYPGITGRSRAK